MPTLRLVDIDPRTGAETDLLSLRPATTTAEDGIFCSQFDLGYPAPRDATQERANQSGTLDYTRFHGSRTVTADLKILDKPYATKEDQLDILTELSETDRRFYLYVSRAGWSGERRMLVRPSNMGMVSTQKSAAYFEVSMSYVCASGVMESATASQVVIAPVSFTATGLSFPIYWPSIGISFAAGSSSISSTVINLGGEPAAPRLRIYGECGSPVIINRTTGRRMSFKPGVPVRANNYIDIDVDTKRVTMNPGSASVYGSIDWEVSNWIYLVRGENEIVLETTNPSPTCRLVIDWRSTFVGR